MELLRTLASCLQAKDLGLAASAAASLGLAGLRTPLELPPGDLASVRRGLLCMLRALAACSICSSSSSSISDSVCALPCNACAAENSRGSLARTGLWPPAVLVTLVKMGFWLMSKA